MTHKLAATTADSDDDDDSDGDDDGDGDDGGDGDGDDGDGVSGRLAHIIWAAPLISGAAMRACCIVAWSAG